MDYEEKEKLLNTPLVFIAQLYFIQDFYLTANHTPLNQRKIIRDDAP